MGKRLAITEGALRKVVGAALREASAPDMSAKPNEIVTRLAKINERLGRWEARVGVGLSGGIERAVSYAIELNVLGEGGESRRETKIMNSASAMAHWIGEVGWSNSLGEDWADDWAEQLPWGRVFTQHLKKCQSEEGAGVWEVTRADAKRGWGILLYEVSLELASRGGGGLVSDRSSVSEEAFGIWDKYEMRRSDVEKLNLDVNSELRKDPYGLEGQTDQTWDDCNQLSAYDHMGKNWMNSPLSKAYHKDSSEIISRLKEAGLLWTLGGEQ